MWLGATSLLTGCGGGRRTTTGLIRRVNPPSASIQSLAFAQGSARIVVRLQNFSTVPTTYSLVDAELALANRGAGRLRFDPQITIPALSSDVVETRLTVLPEAAAVLAAHREGVPYTLVGSITTTDPAGRNDFQFEGALAPVPGRPGEYR
jgi:hypothetical protein